MASLLRSALVSCALCATPAAADPLSGFYAGFYGGVAAPGATPFDLAAVTGGISSTGSVETPSGFVNEAGAVHPAIFDFLSTNLLHYPYALDGGGGGLVMDTRLGLRAGAMAGVVLGYGFGDGLRVEAELASTAAEGSGGTFDSALVQSVSGGLDSGGVWVWSLAGEAGMASPYASLDDAGFAWRTDVQFLLVNAFRDFDTGTAITPYLGGGAGLAVITGTLVDLCGCFDTASATTLAPAAQLGGGLRVALGDPVSLDIGYRLKLAANPGLTVSTAEDMGGGAFTGYAGRQSGLLAVHALQVGLTFALQ